MEAQNRTEYTNFMLKSENSEAVTKQFLAKAKEDFRVTKLPVFEAYIGIGNLFMAKHTGNVFSKMSYFTDGKGYLDSAISKSPGSLEIRFLRYTTQVEMPSFLGYNKNISEDKKFILDHYKESQDAVLVAQIRHFLKI
ncbi:MAG: hypothetical protein H7195_11965 [Chryseobacterium sp.]|nr:hypothetical protein [Chryseobacterium sp.]